MSIDSIVDAATLLEPPQVRAAVWGGKALIYVVGVVLLLAAVGVVVWLVFVRPAHDRQAAAQARAEAGAAHGQAETAKDAVATAERVQIVHDRIERITHDNTTRIMAAPGAAEAVPSAVAIELHNALCLRDAYRGDPACNGLPDSAAQVGDRTDPGDSAAAGMDAGQSGVVR